MKKEQIVLPPDAKPAFGPACAPSFGEMVEQTWREGGRLKDLFARVSQNWKRQGHAFGPDDLRAIYHRCAKIIPHHTDRLMAEKLFAAEDPLYKNGKITLLALSRIFALSLGHSLMLFRIGSGEPHDIEFLRTQAKKTLKDPKDVNARSLLLHGLHNMTGLSDRFAAAFAFPEGTTDHKTYRQWKTGRYAINDLGRAKTALDLWLPDFLEVSDEDRLLFLRALTNRPFLEDIDGLIKHAQSSDDPLGVLLNGIFSEYSNFGITTVQAAQTLGISPHTLTQKREGKISIDEKTARKIARLIKANSRQTGQIVQIATAIKDFEGLMDLFVNGKINFSAAVKLDRTRKNMTQREYAKAHNTGAATISRMENNGIVDPLAAYKFADAKFPKRQTSRARELFEICISGALMNKPYCKGLVRSYLSRGKIDSFDALRLILAQEGKGIHEFFSTHGFSPRINREIKDRKVSPEQARRIENILDMPENTLAILSKNHHRGPAARQQAQRDELENAPQYGLG